MDFADPGKINIQSLCNICRERMLCEIKTKLRLNNCPLILIIPDIFSGPYFYWRDILRHWPRNISAKSVSRGGGIFRHQFFFRTLV